MATRADDLATTYRTWAASREVALHRTAYLLTGDLPTARREVRDALAAALATGRRTRRSSTRPPCGPCCRAGVDGVRTWCSPTPTTAGVTSTSGSSGTTCPPWSRADRGRARARLPRGPRRGRDRDRAGAGGPEVAERTDAALEDLGGLLHLPRPDTEALLRPTLEARAAATRVVPLTYSASRPSPAGAGPAASGPPRWWPPGRRPPCSCRSPPVGRRPPGSSRAARRRAPASRSRHRTRRPGAAAVGAAAGSGRRSAWSSRPGARTRRTRSSARSPRSSPGAGRTSSRTADHEKIATRPAPFASTT